MHRLLVKLAVVLTCAFIYVVSPLYSAWAIRAAVKAGNSNYLTTRIDWSSVKPTLKESMGELAVDPQGMGTTAKRTIWQRIKGYYGRSLVSSMVERYATPTGLPRLFTYGRLTRQKIMGLKDPMEGLSLTGRLSHLWARVRRAEFTGLTSFEMDFQDKYDATRLYCGVLQLRGLTWVLTQLRVRKQAPTQIARLIPSY